LYKKSKNEKKSTLELLFLLADVLLLVKLLKI
jgi:hypothetical protein